MMYSLGYSQTKEYTISFGVDTSSSHEINTLKYYVGTISLIDKKGEAYPVNIPYQLIDLEDKPTQTITQQLTIQPTAIRFTVGTTETINLDPPLEGDLDPLLGMYWAWNSGYINSKIEGRRIINDEYVPFEFHIGGYASPYETVQTVELPISTDENLESIHVRFHVDEFLHLIPQDLHSVLIPGQEAKQLSRIFATCFHLEL